MDNEKSNKHAESTETATKLIKGSDGCLENGDPRVWKYDGEDSEEPKRAQWGSQSEFLLSCLGFAVGLGNIWRFPILCMRNGGGAFLIPYFIFLILCGIPIFFMEMILGQFSSLSPITLWRMCPLLQGVGWGMFIVTSICNIYYNIIIAWTLYYLGRSFAKKLPWADCGHPWNTGSCLRRTATDNLTSINDTLTNGTFMPLQYNATRVMESYRNATINGVQSPAEEFWEFEVIQRSASIDDLDGIQWELLICLVVAWVIVFLCLCKGIKSSGKVVYVTATFPYLLLFSLLIRGLTLPGSYDGVMFYLTPDFHRLRHLKVWGEACLQIFYTMGFAWGSLITMSSYNKFNHNCLRDGIVIPIATCFTSFFGGFVIFSIIGFMAKDAGLPVGEVVTSGPGLVFMAYPEAITRMPLAPFWAILFFLMILTIGLDSQFAMMESLISSIIDRYPKKLRKWKTLVAASMCAIMMLLALPLVTRAGVYYFQIIDWYCPAFTLTIIALLECLEVGWIYGWRRTYDNIEMMIGRRPGPIWRIMWCYVTPAIMGLLLIFSAVQMDEPSYGDYVYPRWAIGFGWGLALISIIPIPVFAVYQLTTVQGTFWQRVKKSLVPSPDFGPMDPKNRAIYMSQISGQKCIEMCDNQTVMQIHTCDEKNLFPCSRA